MNKKLSLIVCALLLAYFVFTSGLVFEVTKSECVSSVDVPPSIALSNYRISALGVFNEDDRACSEWLVNKSNPEVIIRADYNSICLMNGYTDDRCVTYVEPDNAHYLFLNTDNVRNKRFVWGCEAGMRVYQPLPNIDNDEIVYKSGDAVVYYIEE